MVTNDPEKNITSLIIQGQVEKFATVTPRQARLIGTEGQDLTKTVRIVPNRDHPFKVLSARSIDPRIFDVSLKEVKGPTGPEYELTVTNVARKKGRYSSAIAVGTDSKRKPEMTIQVTVYLRQKA